MAATRAAIIGMRPESLSTTHGCVFRCKGVIIVYIVAQIELGHRAGLEPRARRRAGLYSRWPALVQG